MGLSNMMFLGHVSLTDSMWVPHRQCDDMVSCNRSKLNEHKF